MPTSPTIEKQLAQAQRLCDNRGQRLTPVRARVLEILLSSDQPLGAYELLEQYKKRHPSGAQPMTIYRALHFLHSQGLVHHLNSRRQYVACDHSHTSGAFIQLLLCDQCGQTQELPLAPDLSKALQQGVTQQSFRLQQTELELHGLCAHCQPPEKDPAHV